MGGRGSDSGLESASNSGSETCSDSWLERIEVSVVSMAWLQGYLDCGGSDSTDSASERLETSEYIGKLSL